jgi:hypothetical protein
VAADIYAGPVKATGNGGVTTGKPNSAAKAEPDTTTPIAKALNKAFTMVPRRKPVKL